MIKANHKNFWVKFAKYYSKFLLKYYFRNIRYIGEYEKTELPVLIIGNHFSWWDGFIQIQLNNKYYKKKFYFMMLENELKKAKVLTTIGAFSISKRSRSSIDSLNYSLEIMEGANNMLLFFPQGRIQSVYTQKFKFEKGMINHILENLKTDYQLVFNVNLIDYQAYRKPEISVYHKTYTSRPELSAEQIEEDFNMYAQECMNQQRRK